VRNRIHPKKTVFTCKNQSCGTQWELPSVVIKNEGQGPLFRCALGGARNYVERFETDDGTIVYEQLEGRPFN
jgi:type 1 glutamine amidotransferase